MPKASKETASDSMQMEGYEGHYENFDGGYTVAFETYTANADPGELFKGLPDDRCQCEHWGYVVRGKVSAYYMPAGHTPVLYAGTEIVEFSPTKDLQQTMDVVSKNMQAAAV